VKLTFYFTTAHTLVTFVRLVLILLRIDETYKMITDKVD
jgi:hypothetical protein